MSADRFCKCCRGAQWAVSSMSAEPALPPSERTEKALVSQAFVILQTKAIVATVSDCYEGSGNRDPSANTLHSAQRPNWAL